MIRDAKGASGTTCFGRILVAPDLTLVSHASLSQKWVEMVKKNLIKIEAENGELVFISKENGKVVLHVGYSEAEFTNKQVDELIKAIKEMKVRG